MSCVSVWKPVTDFSGWHRRQIECESKLIELVFRFPKSGVLGKKQMNMIFYVSGKESSPLLFAQENLEALADQHSSLLVSFKLEEENISQKLITIKRGLFFRKFVKSLSVENNGKGKTNRVDLFSFQLFETVYNFIRSKLETEFHGYYLFGYLDGGTDLITFAILEPNALPSLNSICTNSASEIHLKSNDYYLLEIFPEIFSYNKSISNTFYGTRIDMAFTRVHMHFSEHSSKELIENAAAVLDFVDIQYNLSSDTNKWTLSLYEQEEMTFGPCFSSVLSQSTVAPPLLDLTQEVYLKTVLLSFVLLYFLVGLFYDLWTFKQRMFFENETKKQKSDSCGNFCLGFLNNDIEKKKNDRTVLPKESGIGEIEKATVPSEGIHPTKEYWIDTKKISFPNILKFGRSQEQLQKPVIHAAKTNQKFSISYADLIQETLVFAMKNGHGRKNLFRPGCRVLVMVQNGPSLSALLLMLFSCCTAVPLDVNESIDELMLLLKRARCTALIIDEVVFEEKQSLVESILTKCQENDLYLFKLKRTLSLSVGFSLDSIHLQSQPQSTCGDGFNSKEDIALILQTSGTSGNRKLVPYTLDTLILGAFYIISAWELKEFDLCYNLMPQTHVGGISRNLLAVALSRGSVVSSPGFDCSLFWDVSCCGQLQPTWYYASPVIHASLLEEGLRRETQSSRIGCNSPFERPKLRFIANAAGNLPVDLEEKMRKFYPGCSMVPGYGLSECMPVSSPPLNYNYLEKVNTSGISVGPEIAIFSEDGVLLDTHHRGEICLHGSPVFGGYLDDEEATKSCFFSFGGKKYFRTGDLGYLDSDQYLFITGRKKEVINRGGEIISPAEVEAIFNRAPSIEGSMAFAAEHDVLQECVGLVVKPRLQSLDTCSFALLPNLHKFCAADLIQSKRPQIVIISSGGLPRNRTGKLLRVKFASKVLLPSVKNDISPFQAHSRWLNCFWMTAMNSPLHRYVPSLNTIRAQSQLTLMQSDKLKVHAHENFEDIVLSVFKKLRFIFVNILDNVVDSVYEDSTGVKLVDNNLRLVAYYIGDLSTEEEEYFDVIKMVLTPKNFELAPDHIFHISCPHGLTYKPDSQNLKTVLSDLIFPRSQSSDIYSVLHNPTTTEVSVIKIWIATLNLRVEDLKGIDIRKSSFFDLGGNSFLAGALTSRFRSDLQVELSIMDLFRLHHFHEMVEFVENEKLISDKKQDADVVNELEEAPSLFRFLFHYLYSFYTIIQVAPGFLFYSVRRVLLFLVFATSYASLLQNFSSRLLAVGLALVLVQIFSHTAFPCLGIVLKWLIMGRYREGKYKTFGLYYLRWYVTKQLLFFCGKGVFNLNNFGRVIYLNLLGANVSLTAKINSNVDFGEYDLIEIGPFVELSEDVICRPFSLEAKGLFQLKRILLGKNSSFGPKSIVCPGSNVPFNSTVGPTLCTREATTDFNQFEFVDQAKDQLTNIHFSYAHYFVKGNRMYCNPSEDNYPGLILEKFLIIPICYLLKLVSLSPALLILSKMMFEDHEDLSVINDVTDVIVYFSSPHRIMYYLAIRVVKGVLSPAIYFFSVVLLKRFFVGKFKPGIRGKRAPLGTKFRHYLMYKLLPDASWGGFYKLVGKHYRCVSLCFRALGAKVGKRVYFPGSGFRIVEHDLLEIGDDVVFGSRSFICCTTKTEAKRVVFKSGSNLADRSVVLPGATISKQSVVGTGTLIQEDMKTEEGKTYLGYNSESQSPLKIDRSGRNLIPGEATHEDLISPFGRAFHLNQLKKTYYVFAEWQIICINLVVFSIVAAYRAIPLPMSLLLGSSLNGSHLSYITYWPTSLTWMIELWVIFVVFFLTVNIVAIAVELSAKVTIIGKRKPGSYNWDESSYCQNWQLYLLLQEFRRGLAFASSGALDFIQGSLFMSSYYRLHGAVVGARCCLFPNGAAPKFTEPDLVELEDDVNIDQAAVINHLNSRGNFVLNKINIKQGAVLKSRSRILTGATMEPASVLTERTLLFQGDTLKAGFKLQGWPASR
eukprot:maker-scaffold_4-snap-gene-15.3-mRNA-1 protein AED:0.42 eAED:0.42 QI:0/0/0/1/1/1/2/0/1996